MELAIMVVFELIALAMNSSLQRVQEAYERSDAFRKHFDQLYNRLNEEYQSKMRDTTPTSSASVNQRNYIQGLMHQRYGQDLLKLHKDFDEIESQYDKKMFNKPAMVIDRLTNEESAKKAIAAENLKTEGQQMNNFNSQLNLYSRRPESYKLMAMQQKGKDNK